MSLQISQRNIGEITALQTPCCVSGLVRADFYLKLVLKILA